MISGLRGQTELLLRTFNNSGLGVYDHIRLAAAYVHRIRSGIVLETTWMWSFRERGAVQQWLRIGLVHQLGSPDG
jgi:hypothetical protein